MNTIERRSSDPEVDLEASTEEVNAVPVAVRPFYGTITPDAVNATTGPSRSSTDPFPTWISAFFALIVFFAFAWFIYATVALGLRG